MTRYVINCSWILYKIVGFNNFNNIPFDNNGILNEVTCMEYESNQLLVGKEN